MNRFRGPAEDDPPGPRDDWEAARGRLAHQLNTEALQLYQRGAAHEALPKFQQALGICREIGNRRGEATVLFNLGGAYLGLGRVQEAMAQFQQALNICRDLEDLVGCSDALLRLGAAYQSLGQFQDALEYFQQALSVQQETGDRGQEAAVRNALGVVYRNMGRPQEALEHYRVALDILRDLGDRSTEGAVHNNLSLVYQALGQLQDALRHALQALELARDLRDPRNEGTALNTLGAIYDALAQEERALEHYEQALDRRRQVGDRRGEGISLSNLGQVHARLGHRQEALDRFQQALVLHREVRDRRGEGVDLSNLGELYARTGQPEEALQHLREALAIHRQVGNRPAEGSTLNVLGQVHYRLGEFEEAARYFQDGLAVCRVTQNPASEATSLTGLASIYEREGQLPQALEHFQRALTIYRELENRHGEGRALNNVGATYRRLGLAQEALEHFRQALDTLRSVGDRDGESFVLHVMGQVYRDLEQPTEAIRHLEQAIEVAEGLRGEILSEELRTSYFTTIGDLYTEYIALLVAEGQNDRAFEAAERAKARSFLELLVEAQAEIREGVDPELREEEDRLLRELHVLRRRLIEERSRAETERNTALLEELEGQAQDLERSYQLNQAEIRRRNPRYAALTQPQAWERAQVQAELLDEQTALLEYVLGEKISVLFVVLSDDIAVFTLPPREEIEAQVRELRAAVAWGRIHRYPHGFELYQTLVQPAEHLIEGKSLLIVADGALHYLPFALLLTAPPGEGEPDAPLPEGPTRFLQHSATEEDRELLEAVSRKLDPLPPFDFANLPYLLRRHAISYAPSASAAGMLRRESRERGEHPPPYDGQMVAFADPLTEGVEAVEEPGATETGNVLRAALVHTRGSLQRIPFTADEVWTLARMLSGDAPHQERPEAFNDDQVRLQTGAAATKEAIVSVTSGEKRYRFFHVASHGIVDSERPQFSGLVFSPGERRDPYWQTFEIFNARVDSEMVVLSACDTGLGRLVQGEGIVGLTRAFMYAGAPTVCVSLWQVADITTPTFMEALYESILAGRSKAEALREAQLHLLEGGFSAHPFYWAPFVLVGERR
jgi:tetratricopeptide (TPR) repeat protein